MNSFKFLFIIQSFSFYPGMVIDWPNGKIPIDEPNCGYRGERCIPPESE